MNINQARKLYDAFTELHESIITNNNIAFSNIVVMSEISDKLKADVIDIKDIIDGIDIPYDEYDDDDDNEDEDPETVETVETVEAVETTESAFTIPEPTGFWTEMDANAEWRLVSDDNLMVSDNGMIVSLDQERVIPQMFIDGELRISIDGTLTKRSSAIICKAFGKRSPDRYGDYVIDYMDGDRRNLSLSNLYWIKKSDRKFKRPQEILHEDICRRIVDHKGNIEEIIKCYENSKPVVTPVLITGLINGHISKNITEKFFTVKDGMVVPNKGMVSSNGPAEGVDVAGFLLISKDKELVKRLLNDKIRSGQKLSIPDKKVLTFYAIDSMGVKKNNPDPQKVKNIISNNYGEENVDDEIISECMADYTSELAVAFGRVKEEE